jgi:flagellar biosynthesis protein FliQ
MLENQLLLAFLQVAPLLRDELDMRFIPKIIIIIIIIIMCLNIISKYSQKHGIAYLSSIYVRFGCMTLVKHGIATSLIKLTWRQLN